MRKRTSRYSEQELSFYERICNYAILEEEEQSDRKYAKICTDNGTVITMNMPHHTEKEKQELCAEIAVATFKVCYPEEDISNYQKIQVIW